jgi:hypothetical protein
MLKKKNILISVIIIAVLAVVLIFSRWISLQFGTTTTSFHDNMPMGLAGEMAVEDRIFASVAQKNSRGKMAPAYDMSDEAETFGATTDRLIIKTGNFSVVVDDVNKAVDSVVKFVEEKKGFLVSSNIYKSGLAPYATVVIRVPATDFDESVGEMKNLGEVTSESVTGRDVTEEYVDLEAQLNNLRATEAQFLEIMKRAVKIEDVLAVQRELTNVRDRIERIEGRMKYLRESADMSTITVNLSTDPEALPVVDEDKDQWKPWGVVKEAARSLLDLAKMISYFIIWLVVYIPLWLALCLVIYIVYRVGKRIMRNRSGNRDGGNIQQ